MWFVQSLRSSRLSHSGGWRLVSANRYVYTMVVYIYLHVYIYMHGQNSLKGIRGSRDPCNSGSLGASSSSRSHIHSSTKRGSVAEACRMPQSRPQLNESVAHNYDSLAFQVVLMLVVVVAASPNPRQHLGVSKKWGP